MATNERPTYDEKLSFGSYIGKEIYQTVVAIGSAVAGAYAGIVAAKKWMPDAEAIAQVKWEKLPYVTKIPGLKIAPSLKQLQYGGIGGLMAGTTIGGLILGYGHWKKEKQAQMQVDEITRDVSNIELFKKTDPELKAENQRLWKLLKEREAKGGNWQAQIQAEAAETTEAARG